jgi:ribosomal protein L32
MESGFQLKAIPCFEKCLSEGKMVAESHCCLAEIYIEEG